MDREGWRTRERDEERGGRGGERGREREHEMGEKVKGRVRSGEREGDKEIVLIMPVLAEYIYWSGLWMIICEVSQRGRERDGEREEGRD